MQTDLNKFEIKSNLFFANVLTRSLQPSSDIAMHKVLNLIALRNNINILVGFFVDLFKHEEGGTILQIVVIFKKMKKVLINYFNRNF